MDEPVIQTRLAGPSNVNVSDLTGAVSDPSRASSATSSLLDSGKKFLSLAFGGNQSSIFDAEK